MVKLSLVLVGLASGLVLCQPQAPINYLQNPSFELDDHSWLLGPVVQFKQHRPTTGKRLATLDGGTASYLRQNLTIKETGTYQLSALVSADQPKGILGYKINHQPPQTLNIPKRWQWHRVGVDNIALNQGDHLEVFFTGSQNFLNVEDAALYLQHQTPFNLNRPEPYRFKLADISRVKPFLVLLFLSGVIGIYGACWGLHWEKQIGGKLFIGLSLSGAIAVLGYAWEVLDETFEGSIFGFNVKYSGWAFFACFLLLFCLWYTGSKWRDGILPRVLLVLAFINSIMFFTNDWHHLMQIEPYVGWWPNHHALDRVSFGAIFSIGQVLLAVVQVLAIGSLGIFAQSVSSTYRKAIFFFGLGLILHQVAVLWNNSQLISRPLSPWVEVTGIDFSTMGLAISLVVYSLTVIRFDMLEHNPTAWGKGQIDIADPLLVTDERLRLVELNTRARSLLKIEPSRQNLLTLVPGLPLDGGPWTFMSRQYQVSSEPVTDVSEVIGYRFVFHDITELDQREQALRQANQQLRELQQELREQAIRDGLTGLYNRRFLDDWLQERNPKELCSLMLFDIDYFREFNARFGYAGGDHVLKAIGAYLNKTLPNEFLACRYGGEEFCVIMPKVGVENATYQANLLRQGIANLQTDFQGKPLSITVSAGLASSEVRGENLLIAADRALQKAKRKGRNRSEQAKKMLSRWGRGWV